MDHRELDGASLIGRWSSGPFDLGVMECFEARCPEPGVVELHAEDGDVTRHRFRVAPVSPVPGAEAVLSVHFDQSLAFAHQLAKAG